MSESIIKEKSFTFAINVIKFYKQMINKDKDMVLSRQILRSGTSIGANVEEGISATVATTKSNLKIEEGGRGKYSKE